MTSHITLSRFTQELWVQIFPVYLNQIILGFSIRLTFFFEILATPLNIPYCEGILDSSSNLVQTHQSLKLLSLLILSKLFDFLAVFTKPRMAAAKIILVSYKVGFPFQLASQAC